MTREIKFRAWHKQSKKMLFVSDIKGVISLQKDSTEIYEVGCAEKTNHGWKNGGSHEIDDVELMQYTGLTDKNGKEIYEGDILTCKLELPAVVEYIEREASFKIVYKEDRRFDLVPDIDAMKVIGNIHENPELLGGEL